MEPNTQQVPGYFVWDVPGQPVVVQLNLDVVDRLGAEIMRGFAAVPKRGAEVGGILLGNVESGERPIVRVEAFQPVETSYGRGPSYLLSEEEKAAFAAAVDHARSGEAQPVGYYRSHTRDGAMSLGPEDQETIQQHFAAANDIVLLVKPFATKAGIGGILVRTEGEFPSETPLEFPFRRREMLGEEAPPRRPLEERGARPRRPRPEIEPETYLGELAQPAPPISFSEPVFTETPYDEPASYGEPLGEAPPPSTPYVSREAVPAKRGGVWLPMCLLFLILGVALGYQVALTFAPSLQQAEGAGAFALQLTAGRVGNSLTVHWDRNSPAILAAERGALEIMDGDELKTVTLNAAQLKEGSVVYQNVSTRVQFRLLIFLPGEVMVAETVDWQ